ncbi:hypothetical protein AAZX31_17G072900 [Glycine max]|uniref:bHLH transcription factor RHL1 isoform X1 n=1 Tax=Glycine max TaxID=3847 RepID=UPI0003DED04C|nr:bHLH transcription factor RHL1 isoform X1 [Glycine max]KAG5097005.1 hypothetical protein JHK82_046859 [Glycine max]KAH1117298.1 hypothetical protein GYH30_046558 [Glycine max]KRH03075.2 hypothetical protein GLYMA_17G075200v4 [Glycine max]|eukprot:XP_006600551.1 transcription factor bHLH69 isoform X1 [Glycine max]
MQPCSREMQGPNTTNSLFNNNTTCSNQPQIHFDTTSNDDFLKQMLSNLPSSSWTLDQTTPDNNVVFPYDVEHANLASKFRNHQITTDNDKASALMLHHHLLLSSSAAAANSQLLHMPFDSSAPNDVVDAPSFKSLTPNGEPASVQALYNGFSGSLQPNNQTHHFQQHPQPQVQGQSFGASAPANGGGSGQPKQRVRARRGQATDPHSIAERLRRERIAERMKALQELVPNANKTDKASMLDEIIDYVKFLQLQVKVLSMSRLGGAAAVAPLVAEGGGDCIQAKRSNSNDSLAMTEQQVAKLMEEDMGSAMQYLQGKGLCLMPISLASAISKATCHPFINGDGPSSPRMSALTLANAVVKDAASVSKS